MYIVDKKKLRMLRCKIKDKIDSTIGRLLGLFVKMMEVIFYVYMFFLFKGVLLF